MRVALSAAIDGELADCSIEHVHQHLSGCGGCRDWQRRCEQVSRRARIGRALPAADLTERVMHAIALDLERRRAHRQWAVAAALVAVSGVVQLVVSLPLLLVAGSAHRSPGWEVLLELVVGSSFFAGALGVLWHTRTAAEPIGVLTVAEREPASPATVGRVA